MPYDRESARYAVQLQIRSMLTAERACSPDTTPLLRDQQKGHVTPAAINLRACCANALSLACDLQHAKGSW